MFGGFFKIEKELSLKFLLIVINIMSCSFGVFVFFLVENVCNNLDEWIRVDGKWMVVVGFFLKINVFQLKL